MFDRNNTNDSEQESDSHVRVYFSLEILDVSFLPTRELPLAVETYTQSERFD